MIRHDTGVNPPKEKAAHESGKKNTVTAGNNTTPTTESEHLTDAITRYSSMIAFADDYATRCRMQALYHIVQRNKWQERADYADAEAVEYKHLRTLAARRLLIVEEVQDAA